MRAGREGPKIPFSTQNEGTDMLARLHSVTLEGIEWVICEVEVDVARGGLEKSVIVGLPDAAVKESTERVKSAIVNSGYRYPKTQSVINLAPADVKKAGPAFDLPIALGMLIGQGTLTNPDLNDLIILGELALDGRVRPVNGVLSMAMTAAASSTRRSSRIATRATPATSCRRPRRAASSRRRTAITSTSLWGVSPPRTALP